MKDSYSGKSHGGGSGSNCRDWYASHDHMPPGPKKLYVTGKCTFPTTGFSVELKPAVPQGINPSIYILNKIVHEPTGPTADVITTVDVRYEEQTDTEYQQVHIMPDDVLIEVKHPE